MITEDERRRMEYEEIYVSYMIKARQVYLARTVVERQCAVNEQRISVLQSNSSFFGRAKRLAEIDQLHQDNEMLKYGIDRANSMLAAIIAELDRMEPNLGERAKFYARDPEGKWLRRQ